MAKRYNVNIKTLNEKNEIVRAYPNINFDNVIGLEERLQEIILDGSSQDVTILEQKVNNHITNGDIHTTTEERTRWNAKANNSDLTTHTGNLNIHVTAEDKTKWNAKADSSSVTNVNNLLTAHTGNENIHVKLSDKENWDSKPSASALGTYNENLTNQIKTKFDKSGGAITGYVVIDGCLRVGTNNSPPDSGTSARCLMVGINNSFPAQGGWSSFVAGRDNTLTATNAYGCSFALGYGNNVSGYYGAAAIGRGCTVTANSAMSFGYNCISAALYSFSEGQNTNANGTMSHAAGYNTTAFSYCEFVTGRYNKVSTGSASSWSSTSNAIVVGNGSSTTSSNSFRVTNNGSVYGLSAFNSSGADYAEFFEWQDQNILEEDRVGYFVTLDGEMIRKANANDEYILGIVSANPTVIGDAYSENWVGREIRDIWGRIEYEWAEEEETYSEIVDEVIEDSKEAIQKPKTVMKKTITKAYVPKISSNFNSEQEYTARENRIEWDAIGMMGKILVRDDGTCKVNGYCKSGDGGIATNSKTGYRVMKRIDKNIIKILFSHPGF